MSCVTWTGNHRKSDGRPMIGNKYAYRVLWERAKGPLPPGAILHHVCGNRWCVNLDHLKPMTQGDHLREHRLPGDWGQANKTHCPQGHEYNAENTYIYHRKNGKVERHCKPCVSMAKKRYRARRATKF